MPECLVEGCSSPAEKRGWCLKHYGRWWRTGSTEAKIKPAYVTCSIEGCESLATPKLGLCDKHYKQQWYLKQQGRTALLERTSKKKWTNKYTGYVMVKHKGKLTYEHIVLAEKALGKPLPAGAIVHHTGARDDNHGPFKLVVCPDQAYHLLLHKRMRELGYENN